MKTFSAILTVIGLVGVEYLVQVDAAAVNVVLNGLAFQSSSVPGQGEAHRAIDGNTNTDFLKGSCSQTTSEYQPWWTVDLRRGYIITNVTITSQSASATSPVPWAEIHVGESMEGYGVYNPKCSVISSMAPGSTGTFSCGGIFGRYLTVVIPSRIDTLTLCEVQVGVLNVPDRQVGLTIRSVSTSGSDLLQNQDIIIKMLRHKLKKYIRILSRGVDNVLQRDNQTCVPMKTIAASSAGSSLGSVQSVI
ncbi:fucolectin-like [Engystomops pustulosus]|uniref:fucolectin-like n=1 Tax=Engystomops pustulosus TaxID=76066 RepID=UPI003AFA5E43